MELLSLLDTVPTQMEMFHSFGKSGGVNSTNPDLLSINQLRSLSRGFRDSMAAFNSRKQYRCSFNSLITRDNRH